MGELFGYSLYCSVYLLMGYAVYRLLLAGRRFGAMNRYVLLGIYAVALISLPVADVVATWCPDNDAVFIIGPLLAFVVDSDSGGWSLDFTMSLILWGYLLGVVVVAVQAVMSLIRLRQLISRGVVEHREGYRIVRLAGCRSPFSFGRFVFIAPDEEDEAVVTAHELAHIGQRHWIDLLISQAVCALMWYNPAAWLMRRELRDIHEYLADQAVIDSGVDAVGYQKILLKKAIGTRLQPFTNSLNQSNIYKRITMMYKKSPSGASRLRVLGLVPAVLAAAAICGSSPVAMAIGFASASSLSAGSQTEAKVTQNSSSGQATEVVADKEGATFPAFPGGEAEMLKFLAANIKYPEAAMKAGTEGMVVVSFAVETSGTISDVSIVKGVSPELNGEAIRVVKSMPRWTPGTNEAGEPITVQYTIPVPFKLSAGK